MSPQFLYCHPRLTLISALAVSAVVSGGLLFACSSDGSASHTSSVQEPLDIGGGGTGPVSSCEETLACRVYDPQHSRQGCCACDGGNVLGFWQPYTRNENYSQCSKCAPKCTTADTMDSGQCCLCNGQPGYFESRGGDELECMPAHWSVPHLATGGVANSCDASPLCRVYDPDNERSGCCVCGSSDAEGTWSRYVRNPAYAVCTF